MIIRIRRGLSFSNVVAFVALFVALGGSVYAAGKISGSQIKPNSIPGNRIRIKTLTAKQVRPDSLTGRQIDGSTLVGTPGNLATVQYAIESVPLLPPVGLLAKVFPPTTASVECPAGTKAIGGGTTVGNDLEADANNGGPTASRTGWAATGTAYETGQTMTVTAICASVASSSG